jgi:hypothetical protein
MNKTELGFWRTELKDAFRALGHCNRIESHATAIGVPDINLKVDCSNQDWWIELKVARSPGDEIEVRPSQWMWHRKRKRHGGLTAFFIRWDRPQGAVYTLNTKIPYGNKDYLAWARCARLVMHDYIDWIKVKETLNHEQDPDV